ncbi:DUF1684 domain-containing protein [Xanthomonas campestris pv. campestris]|uniref:DUF1684 domain-containing protein n=2 Tax=Xanthomonas campestris pv. campestris TaxID=340 RepID=Q8P8E5_XANCP|nr:DUF1684 domain-containing protein [Xanthomonas campestris]AAM41576.1 conserved hypothetical protein [Xanthomonas campestris pv. campestris str. ATCC 33913]AKS16048.1 hypothetical protein AEA00_08985 [Xanthomonas campestris pv. campestris]AKS20066.1 hypothetical protein AEA01_09015 [Xanthomonas campestris pv. campestris]ALE69027.1 hypothetical protein AAW18_11470 [Xanthomonas campestris pv. campestris]PJR17895.1 hypothetical protein ASJ34_06865 [Xanthomonas campestris pv. campestris]
MLVAVGVLGCGREAPPAPAPVALDKTFLADNAAWREARLTELRAPDGWTSLVGLHWLSLKAHYIGRSADSGIRLAVGPPKMGMVSSERDAVWFVPERGAALTVGGKPLTGKIRFQSDVDPQPTLIGFDDGKGVLSLIHRGDRYALRVKHADAPSRTGFAGLEYWPIDPSWRIQARYVPNNVGKTIPIVDIVGISSEQPNAGAIEFERDGKTYRLEAIGEPGRPMFVVFADRTSGHGSYSAGRFLDLEAPDASGHVVVDFNRAINPPCAFTPFATCPLPPPENRIDLAVSAGEKAYKAAH